MCQSPKLFKKFLKIIALVYIYQLAMFGNLMSCGSKNILKMDLVWCTNTHYGVRVLINHGMVKTTKTWISWEQNITFLQNKTVLNLCLRWHILRSYRFSAEVTFNEETSNVKHHLIKSIYPSYLIDKQVKGFLHNKFSTNNCNAVKETKTTLHYKLPYMGSFSNNTKKKIKEFSLIEIVP